MTKRLTKIFLVALAGVSQSGCATVFNGSHQEVWIYSEPAGAPVRVDGVVVGVTPMPASVSRRSSHVVTVGDTLGPTQTHSLMRRPSFWVIPDLLFFWPTLVVDLISGGGFALTPDAVRVELPATAVVATAEPTSSVPRTTVIVSGVAPTTPLIVTAVPAPVPPPTTYLGMLPGQHLRFELPGSKDATVALLDSIVGERVFIQRFLDEYNPAAAPPPPSIVIGEVRHLQVKRTPERLASAGSAMHVGSQLAWVVPMVAMARIGSQERGFRAGAIASAAVLPIAFIVGAMVAPSRWAPLEAQRSGSELMVEDRLRVRQVGSSTIVSGRLVDMDATHLYLRDGPETFRVPRANVVSVDRAQGYDWKARALYGAAVGAMLGFLNVSTCACGPTRGDTFIVPLSSALVGLLAAPALAPRRWRSVTSW